MTQEQILEGNKIIAEFMGIKISHLGVGDLYRCPVTDLPTTVCELEYHESWDWLMPVVENISRWADVNKDKYNEYFWKEPYHTDFLIFRMEINELWLAVVEFIKWL